MPRPNKYDAFGNLSDSATRLRVPDELHDPVAREYFKYFVETTEAAHFAPAERPLLATYCQLFARVDKAEDAIATEGEIVTTPKGDLKPNPWLLILKDCRHQIAVLATKLRLAPNARVESKQVRPGDGPVSVDFSRLGGHR